MTALEQMREDQALGAAWRRAEAALPEGGYLSMGGPFRGPNYHVAAYSGGRRAAAADIPIPPYGLVFDTPVTYAVWIGSGDGPTPTAALTALAEELEARAER